MVEMICRLPHCDAPAKADDAPPPDPAGLIAAAKTPTGRTKLRLTTLATPPVNIRPDPALREPVSPEPAPTPGMYDHIPAHRRPRYGRLGRQIRPDDPAPATGKGICPPTCGGRLCDGSGCPIANCCACDGAGPEYPSPPDNCDADN